MNIYISGISGTGMGPLALMAKNAGLNVTGSDKNAGPIVDELKNAGIDFEIGTQDGSFFERKNGENKIDWFVYTSALPGDHPELLRAKELGIKTSKRDELIAFLIDQLGLKLVAVAGTHGKTTTTSMIIWTAKKLGLKAAYLVGTTLGFAKSGSYEEGDEFFIYEADEYDHNFLHFSPWLSLITFVSYDHPDIYKTEQEYKDAFREFEIKSKNVIFANADAVTYNPADLAEDGVNTYVCLSTDPRINLAGAARREDANTAFQAIKRMCVHEGREVEDEEIIKIINQFPGVGRRFEKIADGIYSDYAHHPEEIAATVEIAKEECERLNKAGVVVLYEPHQNTRQHEVMAGYKDVFLGVSKIFWLPTYLTREDSSLRVISPNEFIETLENKEVGEAAELNDELKEQILKYQKDNYLVILMTAGPADAWLRQIFNVI